MIGHGRRVHVKGVDGCMHGDLTQGDQVVRELDLGDEGADHHPQRMGGLHEGVHAGSVLEIMALLPEGEDDHAMQFAAELIPAALHLDVSDLFVVNCHSPPTNILYGRQLIDNCDS